MKLKLFTVSLNPVNSFGRVTHSLAECFRRLGFSVQTSNEHDKVYDVAIDGPASGVKTKYLLTFWETTSLRPIDLIKIREHRSRKLVVTCKFTQDVLKSHGLKSALIPLAAEYNPKPLGAFKPFVFYCIYQDAGYWQRKRTQDIVDAFELAFKGVADVKLLIKQGPNCRPLVTFDTRIQIIREFLPDVSHIHEQGHVFVSACGAEGWGYPHHDAMAFGRPVICQKIGGPLEFLDDSCAWFVKPHMHKAPQGFYEGYGQIGKVNIKELAAAMRYAYDNKVEVMEKATAAFQRARNFTLDQMTVAVKKAFNL